MVTRRVLGFTLAGTLVALGVALWVIRPAGFAPIDWLITADQQGRWFYERGDYADAARHFRDPMWRGIACYRAHELECAVEAFTRAGTAEGDYNLGVVQAQSGELVSALAASERAVALRPDWREARENHDLIASVLAERRRRETKEDSGERDGEPDDKRVDERGDRSKRGTVEIEKLGPEAIDQLWLRNVRTDPALFLRARFAAEAQARAKAAEPRR